MEVEMGSEKINRLLPCPFCGSMASLITSHPLLPGGRRDTLYQVVCRLRECSAMTMQWYPRKAAVAAWNRRPKCTQ